MKLFYRNYGEGEPIYILHGFLGLGDNWVTLARKLAENYNVFLIDMRNHGQSGHDSTHHYDAMASDLAEMMYQRRLSNGYIIGHSMGGKAAMYFATTYPEAYKKLVVVDIAPKYYPVHHHLILQGLNAVDFHKVQTRQEVESILAKYITQNDTRQFLLKSLYRTEDNRLAWRFNLPVLTDQIENIGQEVTINYPIDKPTLFVRGANSDYILDSDVANIRQLFSDVRIETVANAGHWIHAQQPEAFYNVLINFLKQ